METTPTTTPSKTKMLETDSSIGIFNLILAMPAAQALHIAHEINLFETIGPLQGLTLEAIAEALSLELRPTQGLLSMCISLELIHFNHDKFFLSQAAKDLLLKESPFY